MNVLRLEKPASVALERAADAVSSAKEQLLASLDRVLDLLRPALTKRHHDDAMIALALNPADFEEPLSRHEVIVLACGLYVDHLGRSFTYNDVLELTERFRGRAMNTTMVYKTLAKLVDRKLVEAGPSRINARTERISRVFSVNENGKTAFRLAIMNACQLDRSRNREAA